MSKRRVLLVDDEVIIVTVARIALEREGYFVLTAENGLEALELSRKFPATIHLLVSDIVMPEMDGMELRERITTERPGIKVLLISGQADATAIAGAFLRKPFGIGTLRKRVRQLLGVKALA